MVQAPVVSSVNLIKVWQMLYCFEDSGGTFPWQGNFVMAVFKLDGLFHDIQSPAVILQHRNFRVIHFVIKLKVAILLKLLFKRLVCFLFGSWESAWVPLAAWMRLSVVGIPGLPGETGSFHAVDLISHLHLLLLLHRLFYINQCICCRLLFLVIHFEGSFRELVSVDESLV